MTTIEIRDTTIDQHTPRIRIEGLIGHQYLPTIDLTLSETIKTNIIMTHDTTRMNMNTIHNVIF